MVKGIIFDLWGTLAYNDLGQKRHEAITDLIGPENQQVWNDMRRNFWGLHDYSSERFFRKLVEMIGQKEDLVPRLVEAWEKQLDAVHLFPESGEVLGMAKDMGLKLGLISNTLPITGRMLEILDIRKFFDSIVLSYKTGVYKPSDMIYIRCLDELGLNSEDVFYVGDEVAVDFVKPRKLGMQSVILDRKGIIPHSITNLKEIFKIIEETG